MLYALRTVAPAAPVLTLAEAKQHLRVDHADEDALIESLVATATAYLDGWPGVLGRAFITQTWVATYQGFPAGGEPLILPLAPAQSVASVVYVDAAGDPQTLSTDLYQTVLDAPRPYITRLGTSAWPATAERAATVTVTAVYGYGATAASVPEPIRHAVRIMVGDMYEHRTSVGDGARPQIQHSATVDRLIAPFVRHNL